MAVRTTADKVKEVIQTALGDLEINALIAHANRIVTTKLGGEGLTTALLTDIETWLTAHLIAVGKERAPEGEKIGDIWLTYPKYSTKEFLRTTSYGQYVLLLDTSGKMQEATKQQASIVVIKQVPD